VLIRKKKGREIPGVYTNCSFHFFHCKAYPLKHKTQVSVTTMNYKSIILALFKPCSSATSDTCGIIFHSGSIFQRFQTFQ